MDTRPELSLRKKWALAVALVLIFGLGLAVRLFDLDDAPLDFHPTRQMHSALIARGMYYQGRSDAPAWQRDMAVAQWKAEPHPEPQLVEALAATGYRLMGREALWLPRLLSILFWVGGGAGLFLLARRAAGTVGALVACVYYLFLPYAAVASRSFQPDPLMTALVIFTLLAIARWRDAPTWRNTLLAGALGGLAILVKTTAAFFVAGAWMGMLFSTFPLRQILSDRKVWAAAALSMLPYAGFFIDGMWVQGFLRSEMGLRFFPQLLTDPVFFLQWNGEISSTAGFEWFLTALVCTLLVAGHLRGMLAGVWAGYFVYGLTFAYHISTHDYYQLPLIPLAAVGLAAGAQTVFNHLPGRRGDLTSRAAPVLQTALIAGVLLFFIVVKGWDTVVTLKRVRYDNEIVFWQRLGEKLGREASIVGLMQDAGARLAYWGWVDAEDWFTTGDFRVRELAGSPVSAPEMFAQATWGKDYFVVTILPELERQPELKDLLAPYAVVEQTDDLVIYDLRKNASVP